MTCSTSASLEPSYVLRALGVDDELAHSSLRFGIGRFSTEQEVEFVLELLELHELLRLALMNVATKNKHAEKTIKV